MNDEIDDKKWAWVLERLVEFNKNRPTEAKIRKIKGEDLEDKLIKLNQ